MIKLREIIMIHELKNHGLGVSEIARRTGLDRKTVRKYLREGLQSARYGPRQPRPRLLDPFEHYLRERIAAYPGLSGSRLWREIAELGYAGGYTAVTDFLREARPPARSAFECRFETPPGKQAQVVERTDTETLQGFVVEHIDAFATVYTDAASPYASLPHQHDTVKHSASDFVRGDVKTNGV